MLLALPTPSDAMLHICDNPCCLVPAGVGPPLCGATATVPGKPMEWYKAKISARCRQINAAVQTRHHVAASRRATPHVLYGLHAAACCSPPRSGGLR